MASSLSGKMNPAVPRRFEEGVQGHLLQHKFAIFWMTDMKKENDQKIAFSFSAWNR